MNRPLMFLLLLCLAMVFGCSHSNSTTTRQAMPDRQQQQALEELTRGTRLLQDAKYEDAEKHLQKALEADPFSGLAHNNLGNVYFAQGRFYDAAWQFQYAVKLLPTYPEPRNNLGLVMESTNRLDEAITHYQLARALQPNNPQFLGNLTRAHVRRGDRDDATRQLLRELVIKETRSDWRSWAERELAMHYDLTPATTEPSR